LITIHGCHTATCFSGKVGIVLSTTIQYIRYVTSSIGDVYHELLIDECPKKITCILTADLCTGAGVITL